jgi:cellulose synthase/poly-beta-1,6-N-acetylglucosamine synthase-like glycosyltransferase
MDYTVVIPSYKRPEGCRDKTLALLHKYKIPKDQIVVVVANKEEKELYKAALDPKTYKEILVGVPGLPEVRNWIFDHFPKGHKLVSFDDDVSGFIEYTTTTKRHERELRSLKETIRRGFSECEKANCRFWGVYPTPNGFFMKPTVSTDLKFCVGPFWGCLNPGKDIRIDIGQGEKEDYQRTIQFFQKDGAVVRLNFVAPKTAVYKTPGGLQFGNRLKREHKTIKAMMKRYPGWIKANPTRKSKMPEIRLTDPTKGASGTKTKTRKRRN